MGQEFSWYVVLSLEEVNDVSLDGKMCHFMLSDVQKPTSVQKRVVMFSNGNDNVIEKESKKNGKERSLKQNANV